MQARAGRFDVVVAQYHDQGLIPVKYLGLEKGVNITLGLPFIRTSPDHGTAFDIAGQGIADPASLITALDHAERMVGRRGRSVPQRPDLIEVVVGQPEPLGQVQQLRRIVLVGGAVRSAGQVVAERLLTVPPAARVTVTGSGR